MRGGGTERGTTRERFLKNEWKERERDMKGKSRDGPRQGDELLVKWFLFSFEGPSLCFLGSGSKVI